MFYSLVFNYFLDDSFSADKHHEQLTPASCVTVYRSPHVHYLTANLATVSEGRYYQAFSADGGTEALGS